MSRLNLYEIHIISLLVGFFLVSLIPYFFGFFNIHYVTYPYRVFCLIVSLYIIYINRYSKVGAMFYFIMFFFLLYLVRIAYDLFIVEIVYIKENYDYLATYLGAVVIPAISMCFIPRYKVDFKKVLMYVYVSFYLFALMNVAFTDFIGIEKRMSGITELWPIGFAQAGVSLSILSLFVYNDSSKYIQYIVALGFYFGLAIVFMSATKAAFIFLFFLILLYCYKYGIPSLFRDLWFVSLTFLGLFGLFFTRTTYLFTRLFQSIQVLDESTKERLLILSEAWKKFKTNLWLGDSFLIKTEALKSTYPHNLFLEAFMAMGLLGGGMFLLINVFAINSVRNISDEKSSFSWLIFMFLQYFFQAFFSWSLYSSVFYWILLMTVLFLLKPKIKIIDV
ncbi:O-antigen ligase family protein [Riemerella anatipestifer]|uniref:O-antigen ligase family protein n=1 Tax=Riemerella anatipestifer TaxID=34085 RepID=UPI0021D57804|nr:O-antigen ligase family protein [Riemerella anatipestifer]MCU7570983.1 O-antigen ligase family protein [Riemerella anatipestifer]